MKKQTQGGKIHKLIKEGYTLAQIVKKLKVSASAVYNVRYREKKKVVSFAMPVPTRKPPIPDPREVVEALDLPTRKPLVPDPREVIEAWGLSYLSGCVVDCVANDSGQDTSLLCVARQYLDKLIEITAVENVVRTVHAKQNSNPF